MSGFVPKQGSLQVQVKGKGTFVPCTLEVTDQNIFVTSGRGGPEDRSTASVQGVLIGAPKKARKNHPHVFRVDLAWPDSKGTPKYIFACSTVKERDDWVKLFTQHPSAGKTNGKNQKVPKAFDAKEVAAMEMRSTAMQAGATADVEVPPSSAVKTGWMGLEKSGVFGQLWFVLGVNKQSQAQLSFGSRKVEDCEKYFDAYPNFTKAMPVSILLKQCTLRNPKKQRKDHLHAFRLNITAGPVVGKLILDPGSEKDKREWLAALSDPAKAYRAKVAAEGGGGGAAAQTYSSSSSSAAAAAAAAPAPLASASAFNKTTGGGQASFYSAAPAPAPQPSAQSFDYDAARFVADAGYRQGVCAEIKAGLREAKGDVDLSLDNSEETARLLLSYAHGHRLSASELHMAELHMTEACSSLPQLALFMRPPASSLMALACSLLPFDLLPSALGIPAALWEAGPLRHYSLPDGPVATAAPGGGGGGGGGLGMPPASAAPTRGAGAGAGASSFSLQVQGCVEEEVHAGCTLSSCSVEALRAALGSSIGLVDATVGTLQYFDDDFDEWTSIQTDAELQDLYNELEEPREVKARVDGAVLAPKMKRTISDAVSAAGLGPPKKQITVLLAKNELVDSNRRMTISAGDLDELMAEVLKALGTLEDSAANYFLSIGSVQSLDDAKPVSSMDELGAKVKLQIWPKPKVAEEPEAEAEPEGPCAMVQIMSGEDATPVVQKKLSVESVLVLRQAVAWALKAAGRTIPGSAELQYFDADFEEWTAMVGEDELTEAVDAANEQGGSLQVRLESV